MASRIGGASGTLRPVAVSTLDVRLGDGQQVVYLDLGPEVGAFSMILGREQQQQLREVVDTFDSTPE
jgi:hypothetical protein